MYYKLVPVQVVFIQVYDESKPKSDGREGSARRPTHSLARRPLTGRSVSGKGSWQRARELAPLVGGSPRFSAILGVSRSSAPRYAAARREKSSGKF